jgi:Holliday junction resolvase RusA-like endonuclease
MTVIWIPGTPPTTTQQQHRVIVQNGKPKFIPGKKVEETRKKLMAAIQPQVYHTYDKPIKVTAIWTWPYRTHEAKAVRTSGNSVPKDTRPDTDNLMKALLDLLTEAGAITDDALVSSLTVHKCWGKTPGILVQLEEIDTEKFAETIERLKH